MPFLLQLFSNKFYRAYKNPSYQKGLYKMETNSYFLGDKSESGIDIR